MATTTGSKRLLDISANGMAASNSMTYGGLNVATEQFVSTQVSNLISSAPGALDTLNELAAAIGDDANFATTITNSIATKLDASVNPLKAASVSNDTITFTRADNTTFAITTSDANTDTNYYLNGITRSGNTLTFSVSGTTNRTYTFGSAAWSATSAFDGAGSADAVNSRIDSEIIPLIDGKADASHTHSYLPLAGGTITGGITISGSLSRGSYTTASQYHTGADNIVLKGNASGISGIFFESEKNGTNINHTSDFGYIQYHPYGTSTSGESNELVIGVSNDSDDHVILNAPNANGLKFRVAASNTDYTIWHSGNDAAGSGLDADLLDGYHASTTRNSANTIPIRDGNGYLNLGWINTTSGNTTSTITDFYVNTGDGYIRKATKAHVKSQLGLGSAAYVATSTFDAAGAADAVNERIDSEVLPSIPTNNNELTNGAGYITGFDITTQTDGKYLRSNANDTFSGALVSNARNNGIFGTYDSYKTDHIWSMGTAYKNSSTGADFGNLYGLAYKHTNNSTGGTMAGGHQMVWCTNGNPKAALGENGVWASGHGTSANWKQAYDNYITGAAFSGTTTKTLTLTQRDGGTITASFSDASGSGGDGYLSGLAFNTGNGILTATVTGGTDVTVDLDGRYEGAGAAATVNTRIDEEVLPAIGDITLASLGFTGAANANYITNNNQLTNGAGYLTSTNDRVYITDSRGAARAPSYYNDRYAQWDFQNTSDTGAGGDSWHALLTVSKWSSYNSAHRQEQLIFTGDNLKRRTATSDSAWGTVKTIWDSGNLDAFVGAAVSNDTITFTKANGGTVAVTTSDANTWRGIHDTPVDGATTTSISSNWAFDNVKTAVPANAVFTDTDTTYSVGDGGLTQKNFTTTLKNKLDGIASSADNYGEWYLSGDADSQDITSGKWVKFAGASSITGAGTETNPYIIDLSGINTDTTYSVGDGGLTQKNFTTARAAIVDSFSRNSVSGNIGIGTTDVQNGKFVISNGGTSELKFLPADATSKTRIQSYSQTYGQWVGAAYDALDHVFRTSNTDRVVIDATGLFVTGVVTASGDITAFSDARVKENIKTIDNALDKVTQLRGVEYNKIGSEEKSIGVVAQEIKEVLPEVVREGQDGMLSVAYGNITGVLIEAIKEQQKQIEELKAQLDGLTK